MDFRTTAFRAAALGTAALLGLSVTGPAAADEPVGDEVTAVPAVLGGELSAGEEQTLAALTEGSGVQLEAFVRTPDGAEVVTFDAGTRADARAAADVLAAQPSVESAVLSVTASADAGARAQYGNTMLRTAEALAAVDGPLSDVVVAVLDTGVNPHTELAAAMVRGQNFTSSPGGALDTTDRHGHGTHVAGTVGADAGSQVEGVAPGVRIMPVKVLDDSGYGSSSWINSGIVWAADNGADVINMSLSGGSGSGVYRSAVDYARAKGVTVIAAAGNNNHSLPAWPAAEVGVVGIAAVDEAKTKAWFSNYGSYVDLAGPGVGILSTDASGGYSSKDGTSMAAPHVAGVAALIEATAPGLTPDQVERAMVTGAADLGAPGRDDVFGHGLVDALRSVRAAAALEAGTPPPGNAPPTADDETVSTTYDPESVSIDVLAGDTDPDGDGLGVASFTQGARGAVTADGLRLKYAPSAYGPFTDSFTYVVTDHRGGTATGTVRVTVADVDPANRTPVAADDSVTVGPNAVQRSIWTAGNDSDPDGDRIRVISVTQPALGTTELLSGYVYYTAPAGTSGTTWFEYRVSDGRGGFDTARVDVTVRAPNRVPTTAPDRLVVAHDAAFADIDVAANDTDLDGDVLYVTSLGTPSAGTATRPWTGSIVRYTPSGDLPAGASDTVTYQVDDYWGGTATGTVEVIVDPTPPAGAPGAPTATGATGEEGSATVRWTAPAATGSSPVSGYRVRAFENGSLVSTTVTGAVTSTTVPGLRNGRVHTFAVAALNGAGTGPDSGRVSAVPGATTPAPPVITSVTPGDRTVTLTWEAGDDGGTPLTGFGLLAYRNGSWTGIGYGVSSGSRSYTVRNLTNGAPYTFRMSASNAVGSSPQTAATTAVTPRTAPGAPVIGQAAAQDGAAVVSWSAPGTDGGAPVTGYTVRVHAAGAPVRTVPVAAPDLRTTVTGLENGTPHTFTVVAANAAGSGPESAHSAPVTPAVAATVPSAPSVREVTTGDATAQVSWSVPTSDGGSPVTGYLVQTYRAGALVRATSAAADARTVVVTGLRNGAAHTVTVAAVNAVGVGAESAASSPVIPAGRPAAPAIGVPTAQDGGAVVRWAAPPDTGGRPVLHYAVRVYRGAELVKTVNAAASALDAQVTGLVNGVPYVFVVAAVTEAGTGQASATSAAVVPRTVPGRPRIGRADALRRAAVVRWSAPATDGGAVVSGYVVRVFSGGRQVRAVDVAATARSSRVAKLVPGRGYTFRVVARNDAGSGAVSASSKVVRPRR